MTRQQLIKIITSKLEQYGMPKFKDNLPAIDILKTIEDSGVLKQETSGYMTETPNGEKLTWTPDEILRREA